MEYSTKCTKRMLHNVDVETVTVDELQEYISRGANPAACYKDNYPFMAELANQERFEEVKYLSDAIASGKAKELLSDKQCRYVGIKTMASLAAKGNYDLIEDIRLKLELGSIHQCDISLREYAQESQASSRQNGTLCHKAAMNGHTDAAVRLFYPEIEKVSVYYPGGRCVEHERADVNPVARLALQCGHYDTCLALIDAGSKLFSDNNYKNNCIKTYLNEMFKGNKTQAEQAWNELHQRQEQAFAKHMKQPVKVSKNNGNANVAKEQNQNG